MNFLTLSITEISNLIQQKQVSPVEVTSACIERINRLNPKLNAFITISEEKALDQARRLEQELMDGHSRSPLHGIPIGLKDLINTSGIRTTMGSKIYKDHVPETNATVVDHLSEAGAIFIGKLNTHEFAYGPSGDVSFFGPVRNPYDSNRMSGGSSSGSGVAVATAMAFGALGTDTGGSIRIPSSACGIIGMKPTFGRVSKRGVFPLGYTLDHVGPMTRTIEDNAMMLNYLAGFDVLDPYSLNEPKEDFTRLLGQSVKDMVVGVPDSFYYEHINDSVRHSIEQAIQALKGLGMNIRPVSIDLSRAPWAQLMTVRGEAYAVHLEHIETHKDHFQPEVLSRLELSKDTPAYEYVKAQQLRYEIRQSFLNALEQVDVLIAPALPILPPPVGERETDIHGYKEPTFASLLRLNGPTNLTGLPSLAMPSGFSKNGLPIGMQLIGKPLDEAKIYQIGYAFEQDQKISTLKWDV
ncbi:amidase [Ammoniphilus sp. YIM 78166]|uniref:amidase n=1 Tax=Ammoniphilus sp. YIM 78166 TaxID=1644106 RepID=UPI0010700585|nr:amidase [Ammoniphilus sp. YIM 78166]